jgi:glucose-1-phosphate thymidylyltransferase
MRSIILAAGYGTRLGSVAQVTAKPLIPIAGKPIIEHLLIRILHLPEIEEVIIVTNGKFFNDFVRWKESFLKERIRTKIPIHLLNDHTQSNDERLGAVRDMALGIDEIGKDSDILISASDDIFYFNFQLFVEQFKKTFKTTLTLFSSDDIQIIQNSGNAQIDDQGRVLTMVEKPFVPISNFISPCLYILSRSDTHLINRYLQTANNPDAPGHFISWLVKKTEVYSFIFNEPFYTVGTKEAYEHAKRMLED